MFPGKAYNLYELKRGFLPGKTVMIFYPNFEAIITRMVIRKKANSKRVVFLPCNILSVFRALKYNKN